MNDALRIALVRKKKRFAAKCLVLSCIVERPLVPCLLFDVWSMSDADAIATFRFNRRGVIELAAGLRLLSTIITETGDRALVHEALCILLHRLAHSTHYYSQVRVFGGSTASMCRVLLAVLRLVHCRWTKHMYFCVEIVPARVSNYCGAISRKGGAIQNAFGLSMGPR